MSRRQCEDVFTQGSKTFHSAQHSIFFSDSRTARSFAPAAGMWDWLERRRKRIKKVCERKRSDLWQERERSMWCCFDVE